MARVDVCPLWFLNILDFSPLLCPFCQCPCQVGFIFATEVSVQRQEQVTHAHICDAYACVPANTVKPAKVEPLSASFSFEHLSNFSFTDLENET